MEHVTCDPSHVIQVYFDLQNRVMFKVNAFKNMQNYHSNGIVGCVFFLSMTLFDQKHTNQNIIAVDIY